VLEIVERQQQRTIPQVSDDEILESPASRLLHIECGGDRRRDVRSVAHRGQHHDITAIIELVREIGTNPQGDACLAGAACAGKRHQANAFLKQQRAGRRDELVTADQRRSRRRLRFRAFRHHGSIDGLRVRACVRP